MGSATSAISTPCCCTTSTVASDSLPATVQETQSTVNTKPERPGEAEFGERYSSEQAQSVPVNTSQPFISIKSSAADPDVNVVILDCDEQGITTAEGDLEEVQIRMAQFVPLAHQSLQQHARCSREDRLDSSKSRSSQLRVSFTVALRFDEDTCASDVDSCELTSRSMSTLLLSSGPLSPQTVPAGAASVGLEPAGGSVATVVVPLTRDDVKHRHQQAVPRAARSRNNRIRDTTARQRQSSFPERQESRAPGIGCSVAQHSLTVSNPLPRQPQQQRDSSEGRTPVILNSAVAITFSASTTTTLSPT